MRIDSRSAAIASASAGSANVSEVVAPPYDQISPAMQERLYAMQPDNIVRVSYPGRSGRGPARPPTSTRARRRDARAVAARGRAGRARTATRSIRTRRPTGRRPRGDAQRVRRARRGERLRAGHRPAARAHARRPQAGSHAPAASRPVPTSACCSCSSPTPTGGCARPPPGRASRSPRRRDLRGERHRLWRITDPDVVARVRR